MKKAMLLAVSLAVSVSAVQANTGQASVKLSNLTITAFDLNPTDQYLPSFEFIRDSLSSAEIHTTYGVTPSEQQVAHGFMAPASVSHSDATKVATARIDPTGLEVKAAGSGDRFVLNAVAKSSLISYPNEVIRIAPRTGVSLSGTVELSASGNCSAGPTTTACRQNASFSIVIGTQNVYLDTSTLGSHYTGPVTVTLTNTSSVAYETTLNIHANAFVLSDSTVPEPSSYALLVAGGLTAGWMGRRRQQKL